MGNTLTKQRDLNNFYFLERAKSPKGDKAAKGAKGKRNSLAVIQAAASVAAGTEEEPDPLPIELKLSVNLTHWKTAMDCFKTEPQIVEPQINGDNP